MKEELQGKLVEILTSIQTAAGKASDFAMAELPDIAQSYIAYGRAAYTAGLLLAVALLAVACFVAWRGKIAVEASKQKYRDRHDGREPGYFDYYDGTAHWVPAAFGAFIGGAAIGIVGSTALLVWLAPKVWLLKEIAGMLK